MFDEMGTPTGDAEKQRQGAKVRPGSGGRQAPLRAYTLTTATAQLYEQFGEPVVSRHGDALMQIWVINPEGDGMIGARLSSRDVQNGETAMGQVHPAMAMARERGLEPRLVVVTTENSGGLAYDQRCDFELIEREIFAGRCRWVWYRDVKRLIRNVSPFYRFRDLLLETDTHLWLTDYAARGKPIDWDSDDIQLGIEAIIAERDRKSIYAQTHSPLMTRWLAEGRGWPGAVKFGFRRNPLTKYIEVDPEQWPFVRMIFEIYVCKQDEKGGGVRAVAAALDAAGCPLSDNTIKRTLKDPSYVTGELSVTRDGVVYACRPVGLDDPIAADMFERAQQLRTVRRGKEQRYPSGYWLLHGLVEHECGCPLRVHTKGRGEETATYCHYRYRDVEKQPGCFGWSIDARELEKAVIREVRRLAKCADVQEEWMKLARPRFAEPQALLGEAKRDTLESELNKLIGQRDRLEADFIQRLGKGADEGDVLMSFHRLTGGLEGQIKSLRERVAQMEVLDNVRQTTRPPDDEPLVDALLAVLTEEPPDDAQLIRKRAALLKTVLSKAVIYDTEDGGIEIELHGTLIPDGVPPLRPLTPIVASRDILVSGNGDGNGHSRRSKEKAPLEADAVSDQPGDKGYLTSQLVPPPVLPKIRRPGRSKRPRAHTPAAARLVPAWCSPRLPTALRARSRATSSGR
jgi:hypothetical protein